MTPHPYIYKSLNYNMFNTKLLSISALVAIISLVSCNTRPLIPKFPMGMSEQELKQNIQDKSASGEFIKPNGWDSSEFIYHWKLLDTTIYTTVAFNSDGAPYGSLRICSIYLNDTVHSRVIQEPYETVNRQILDGEEIFAAGSVSTKTSISYSLCPLVKYNKVLAFLRSNFGKEDSITYRINKNLKYPDTIETLDDPPHIVEDTIYTYYHFHNAKSTIVMKSDRVFPQTKIIPYSHLNSVWLYQISNSYEADLKKEVDESRKGLKASDIITLPVQYDVKKERDRFGFYKTILSLRINIGESQFLRTNLESREISAMKGRIIVSDQFADVLYSSEDIELKCKGAIKPIKPGLDYAINYDGFAVVHPVKYNFDLNMNHKSIPDAFRRAVQDGNELRIQFVPDVLLFSDGSILK